MTIISTIWAGIPQKKWSSHHGQQKSPKCSTWVQYQRQQNDLCSFPRQTIFQGKNITVIQVYIPTHNAEKAEVEWFYEDVQHLLELKPKKDFLLIVGDWNANRKSRDIWNNKQIWLGVQNEAGQKQCQRMLKLSHNCTHLIH